MRSASRLFASESFRKDRPVYLDNNATTRLAPEVRAALLPLLDDEYGNPSSSNALGQRAKERVMLARHAVANALGAATGDVMFTGSATEANHQAILGALRHFGGTRRHIISSTVEHPSTLKLLHWLKQRGYPVTLLPVDQHGALDLDELKAALGEDTAIVSIMWANNETGVIFPVERIAQLAKSCGALFHTDAVQAVGRLPLDWKYSNIDLLSFSGHKLHAPKGIGALLLRNHLTLTPLLFGSQERNRRGGTENMLGIVGLGVAATLLDLPAQERVGKLCSHMEQRIVSRLPFARINGQQAPRVSNTSNIRFGNLNAEALLVRLERAGVIASHGAACEAGGQHASHVLTAMGLDQAAARASLRFSLSRHTSAAEIDRATEAIIATTLELAHQETMRTVF
ncbi:MAG TPA: aminotransferase class V-fold PLP-dependent enzyme [Gallionella sp.]|nr:aminotransferase class V-fold PLP-dependent enzyme [Gallionella sp.]